MQFQPPQQLGPAWPNQQQQYSPPQPPYYPPQQNTDFPQWTQISPLTWATIALLFCASIIGLPIGLVMFNFLLAVLTLQQH